MKQIVIVPSWIQKVLAQNGRAVKEALEYNKLCELLTPKDRYAFLYLQSHGPFCEYQINESDSSALLNAWKKGLSPEQADELDSLVNSDISKQIDKDYIQALIAGVQTKQSSEKAVDVIVANTDIILVVINENYFSTSEFEHRDINIVESILRTLYGEFVPEDVCVTSLFKRYVVLLEKLIS